jgi:hypothetical protein
MWLWRAASRGPNGGSADRMSRVPRPLIALLCALLLQWVCPVCSNPTPTHHCGFHQRAQQIQTSCERLCTRVVVGAAINCSRLSMRLKATNMGIHNLRQGVQGSSKPLCGTLQPDCQNPGFGAWVLARSMHLAAPFGAYADQLSNSDER